MILRVHCAAFMFLACSCRDGATPAGSPSAIDFELASPVVAEGGMLPVEYTCDGEGATLPLSWTGAPAGTQSLAVIMHHVASPTDIHWYWVLFDLPPVLDSLPENVSGLGRLGNNSVNGHPEYSPPCSQGPGQKMYTYTLYALSCAPAITIPDSLVSRAALLAAIAGTVLDSAMLHVTYTRPTPPQQHRRGIM
jgi:phosphatidylethanolamine-binding protein (PEBP) family uncharacterized protein